MTAHRPRIDYFAMGGTIASVRTAPHEAGAVPTLGAAGIAAAVPDLDEVAQVHPHDVLLVPSTEITVTDLLTLVEQARAAVDAGARGIVVSQGTDTIEETAFVLDLLWDRPEPLVVTGAMRNPSLPGADGAANVLAAVQVASCDAARETGVLVTLNDEIHAARHVHKSHTSSPSTFVSPGLGPIGWVSEGNPVIALRPTRRTCLTVPKGAKLPSVALVKLGLADDCRLLGAVASLGYDAVVIEALGGGHVPVAGVPIVAELAATMPVVLASRTGAGEVLGSTYRFPGSEIDLLERGALRAGALDGPKARLLLTLALAAGSTGEELTDLFARVGTTTTPVRRPGARRN